MQGTARVKVPGGKMVSVKAEYSDRIEKIEVLGDFFLHPEDAINDIQESLLGAGTKETMEALSKRICDAIQKRHAELIGATPDAIARAVLTAVNR